MEPQIRDVFITGTSASFENQAIPLERNGKIQQAYWTYSHSPIFVNDGGDIGGVLVILGETTENVLQRRKEQASADQLRLVADFSPALIAYVDRDERYQFINGLYEKWFNFEPAKTLGRTILDVVGPVAYEKARTQIESALEGKHIHFENHIVLASGDTKYIDLQFVPFRAQTGEHDGFIILGYDVSERKKIEVALRESEARYRDTQEHLTLALESAQMSTWHIDLKSNRLRTFTDHRNPFAGDSQEFDIDETIEKWIHPDDALESRQALKNTIENGVVYNDEYRVIRSDGSIRWMLSRGSAKRDENGKAVSISGVLSDITERKQTEDQYRAITELTPQFVWMGGTDGSISFSNSTLLTYMGLEQTQTLGQRWLEALHPDDRQNVVQIWENSLKTGQPYEAEFRIRAKDGTYGWFLNRAIPLRDKPSGKITSWLGVSTDITELKRVHDSLKVAKDEAEKANSSKSAFLANMSHEIRTPLGAIMGFVNLLKDETIARSKLDQYLSIIDRNSSQLLRVIDDILDLSKVEAGMIQIEQIDFSLPEMLQDFSSLMSFRAREKGLSFDIHARTSLPTIVNSDPTRIRQILINIVGNAIKFTSSGRVSVHVSYEDGILEFEVQDTGAGISAEQVAGLFQPFSQADASITRKYGGTGLGLVLTRGLTEALGGQFFLKESRIDQGSTFVARIKVEVAGRSRMVKSLSHDLMPSVAPVAGGGLNEFKVLVVDDSPDNQALISIFLQKSGASVEIANNGAEGIKAALEGSFDVVLMDIQMPVMDGLSAVKVLRQRAYQKPVIALTAHAMKEERERCLSAGFSDFLTKPVQRNRLISMLTEIKSSSEDL